MTVKQQQWQLYYLGYYMAGIDGIFGSKSLEATKKFQSDHAISPTGSWDDVTVNKSIEVIKDIQEFLSENLGINLTIDGLAGQMTQSATLQYQQKVGLTPDGIAGEKTRGKIAVDKEDVVASEIEEEVESDDFWSGIEHFTREEFRCKCGGKYCNGFPVEPDHQLVLMAENVRNHFGVPITISSGIRCKQHNANVGGVYNSRHLSGKAMDFSVSGKSASQILSYVNSLSEIRYAYAIDSGWVHMDVY